MKNDPIGQLKMKTRWHLKLDIRGCLKNASDEELNRIFQDENEKLLSTIQAKDFLMDELLKGHKYIPVGKCDNFDFKENGCLGHKLFECTECECELTQEVIQHNIDCGIEKEEWLCISCEYASDPTDDGEE